jgi:hypothetical protein
VIPVLAGKKHASPAWKPVVLYGGSKRLYDGAIAGGSELEGFTVLVERLTLPGQLVVDPLLGDGTALLAAHIKGRHAFGRGVSANAVAAVRRRFVGPVTVRRTA